MFPSDQWTGRSIYRYIYRIVWVYACSGIWRHYNRYVKDTVFRPSSPYVCACILPCCFACTWNDNKQSKLIPCSCISSSVVLRVSNYMGYVSFMSTRVISFEWLPITFLSNHAMTVQRVCLIFVHLIHCIMHGIHIVALITGTWSRNERVELLQPTVIQKTN